MGCEKGKGGFVTAMRSSMERRRVSNAKVTSLRQRNTSAGSDTSQQIHLWYQKLGLHRPHAKYQELTMQIEQENLQRAKEILERRKSERDRLNKYIHSVGDAKHPDMHLRGMRRPNTEGTFGRPPWTASLRTDYETLIKLREKEIAVATLKIKNHKQLPMHSEAKATNHTNGRDDSYLSNKEFEFHHDELELQRFDSNHKSNGSAAGRNNNLNVLGNEDIGRDHLMLEPTVFREHSFNGLRFGANRALPPTVPTSNSKPATPCYLKSCLKSNNKHNQKSSSPQSETTSRALPLESSMPCGRPAITNPKMETALNGPPTLVKAMTHSKMKPMTNHDMFSDMFSWVDYEDRDSTNDSKERPQPANDIGQLIFPISNFVSSEENVTAKNALPDPAILRPTSESEVPENMPDTPKQSDTPSASSPADIATATLPPRYTSTTESWQEDRNVEPSIPDECPTSPLLSPHEDKTYESEEQMFMTSLDSEAATTRLIAEVIAVQSRLEDCKLKPLDFRNMFADPQHRLEQQRSLLTPAVDNMRSSPEEEDQELVRRQKKQGTIEVTMRNHEIFRHEDEATRPSILDDGTRKEGKTAGTAANASSIDEHEKEVLATTNSSKDNFTEIHTFEEMESRKPLQGAAWEIPWKNDVGQQRRPVDEQPLAVVNPGCPTVKTANSTPFPCTIAKPPKPVGSTLPVDKIKQPRGLTEQQPCLTRHVLLQTDELKQQPVGENQQTRPEGNSRNQVDRAENTDDCSLTSTSKYLNIGYRDLSEAPRPKYTKQHCFYSSHGLLPVGYSQSRPSVKQQNLPHAQLPCGFHDSLGDKENYGSDDQELSILASLERLDWKLAAISARAMNRTSITPSMVSHNQTSIQSAPAATGVKIASTDGTPRKHPLRPSSVRTQKPPTRNFRQRRIVGVTNKCHPDIFNC